MKEVAIAVGVVLAMGLLLSPILYGVWRGRAEYFRVVPVTAARRILGWSTVAGLVLAAGIILTTDGFSSSAWTAALSLVAAVGIVVGVGLLVVRLTQRNR